MAAPLAVILGWGNATDRQLEPYRRLWRRLGAEPRTFVANALKGTFSPGPQIDKVRREARAIARASEAGARDIWVHAFSDNGFITWGVMLEELAALPDGVRARDAVRGVVFDSAPGLHEGRRRHEFAYRMARGMTPGLLHLLGREARVEHPLITPALELGFGALYTYRAWRGPARSLAIEIARMYDRVLAWEPAAPQLYLYAEHDLIVRPAAVERHVARERARGVRARAVMIEGAAHVACWPAAPDTYEEEVEALVSGRG